ncbi:MAG: hypothetical protein WD059_13840 [Balneolaceae bacterium]
MLTGNEKIKNPALVLGSSTLASNLSETEIPCYSGSEKSTNGYLQIINAKQEFSFSPYHSDEFITELKEAGEGFTHKPVIFCDDNRAILKISNNREALRKHYLFLYPSIENVNRFLDSQRFFETAKRRSLPVPETFQISGLNEIQQIASFLTFPCIIKPTNSKFWKQKQFEEEMGDYHNQIRCANSEKLIEIYKRISKVTPSVVVQNWVVSNCNQEYSTNLFIDHQGATRGLYIAHKANYAKEAKWEMTENETIINMCKEIIASLEVKGLINIRLKQDCRTGEFKLLKISTKNMQMGLSNSEAEINLLRLYYQHLVKEYQLYEKIRENEPMLN